MSKRECLKRVQHQPPNTLFVLGRNAENIRNGQKISPVSVLSSPPNSTYGFNTPDATENKPRETVEKETTSRVRNTAKDDPSNDRSSQEALQVVNESMTIAQKRQKVFDYLSTLPNNECRPIIRIIQTEEHYNGKNVTTLRSLCQKEIDIGNASHSMIFSLFEYLDAFQTDKNRAKELGEENEARAEMFGFTTYDNKLGLIDKRDLTPFPTEKLCRVQKLKEEFGLDMSDSDSDLDSESKPSSSNNVPFKSQRAEDKSSKLCTVECSSAGILASSETLASKDVVTLSDSPRSTSDSSSGVFKKPYPPGHRKMKQLHPSPDKFKFPTSIEKSSSGNLKRRAQESSSSSSNLDGQKSDSEPVCKKKAPSNKIIERTQQLKPASIDLPQQATIAAPQPLSPMKEGPRTASNSSTSCLNLNDQKSSSERVFKKRTALKKIDEQPPQPVPTVSVPKPKTDVVAPLLKLVSVAPKPKASHAQILDEHFKELEKLRLKLWPPKK